LCITGFKNDIPILQLFVDDVLVDQAGGADDELSGVPMISLWSEDVDSMFADEQFVLNNIRYHVVRRLPDELDN